MFTEESPGLLKALEDPLFSTIPYFQPQGANPLLQYVPWWTQLMGHEVLSAPPSLTLGKGTRSSSEPQWDCPVLHPKCGCMDSPTQIPGAGKDCRETWTPRMEEVWRGLVVEQESACDTERQEQGKGWTGALWIPKLWRGLAQAEEQTRTAGSSGDGKDGVRRAFAGELVTRAL